MATLFGSKYVQTQFAEPTKALGTIGFTWIEEGEPTADAVAGTDTDTGLVGQASIVATDFTIVQFACFSCHYQSQDTTQDKPLFSLAAKWP